MEPFNQGISVRITNKTSFAWNPHPRRHSSKGVFQIHPPVSDFNFSNNISELQVRANIRETEHDTTFEIS